MLIKIVQSLKWSVSTAASRTLRSHIIRLFLRLFRVYDINTRKFKIWVRMAIKLKYIRPLVMLLCYNVKKKGNISVYHTSTFTKADFLSIQSHTFAR